MKNSIYRIAVLSLILLTLLVFIIVSLVSETGYPVGIFFPLDTNDKYIYEHCEGNEKGIVKITVKNVKQIGKEKYFNFFWQGRYNDRIQSLRLTPKGLIMYSNRHLVGEVPLKVIRKFSPPLLMIPSRLSRSLSFSSIQSIWDLDGRPIGKENINVDISFLGLENVNVKAGSFRCLHFAVRHNYKDASGNSIQMHTYNFWIAPGVGIVKFIHAFIPFIYVKYIPPEKKDIMSRYSGAFVEIFDLREALIKGKTIGNKY